jgi:predicted phage gp36 major capsid-like protein
MEIRGERNGDGEDLLQIVENRRSRAVELLEDQDERLREAKQINKRLKAKLKRYEDGTSLNNDVLMADGGNPLFVVNGRLGLKG